MAVPTSVDGIGNVTLGTAVSLAEDAQRAKGRPSVVQLAANQSVIFDNQNSVAGHGDVTVRVANCSAI